MFKLLLKKNSTIYNLQSIIYNRKGFTLIELLVVIAIISILASFIMANFVGIRQRGRDGERKSDLRQIQAALEIYRSDNSNYPTSGSWPSCGDPLTDGSANYMEKIPCDPIDGAWYSYTATPDNPCDNSTTICSGYTLHACLENAADPDKDDTDGGSGDKCPDADRVSFTVTNP